jgi:hypothetical protein
MLLLACDGGLFGPSAEELLAEDNDADGFSENEGDCNDANPDVFPNNPEICDGLDNDCDGLVDDSVAGAFFLDVDDDGYGGDTFVLSCTQPAGYVPTDGDCDDEDPSVNPEGVEDGCDNVDDDCDGDVDEGFSTAFYVDSDEDGYGDPDTEELACESPGDDFVENDFDCDDTDPAVNPLAADICNDVDDDCDGELNEDPDILVYADIDGDGWGDESVTQLECSASEGWSATAEDCDDDDPEVNPSTVWYLDTDGDGYGVSDTTTQSCLQPEGYVDVADDCDDARGDVFPDAPEACDDADQDCDGLVDEGTFLTFYLDQDGDGYGGTTTSEACSAPSNYVDNSDDCDDSDGDVGLASTYYLDADGDGWGLASSTTTSCALPSGYSAYDGDCNDGNNAINPDGTESCNAADDDCDGDTDEGVTTTYYEDADADSYGLDSSTTEDCTTPSGYADEGGDCDDGDNSVNPDATEVCDDGVDNDCDGSAGSCGISALVSIATGADAEWEGEVASDLAGQAIAVGDMDGDGNQDVLVGAYRRDSGGTNSGSVYLIYGPDTSGGSLQLADEEILGASGSRLGKAMASTDTNGDGVDDLIVAATNANVYQGVIYAVQGPVTTSALSAIATGSFSPADSYCCDVVLAEADFNGDGDTDLVAGGQYYSSSTGRVYLVHGPLTGTLSSASTWTGTATRDFTGQSVAVADFTGDGTADLLIGSPKTDELATDAGAAFLVHGPASTSFTLGSGTEDLNIRGAVTSNLLGSAVAAGDLDGDGTDDLIVGAEGASPSGGSSGAVYVFYGPQTGLTKSSRYDAAVEGVYQSQYTGSVVRAADMDGDGQDDLIVGSDRNGTNSNYGNNYYSGLITIHYGPLTGTTDTDAADSLIYGAYYDQMSTAIVVEDWDGDGDNDLWLGAPGHRVGGTLSYGAAYLVLGGGL